MSNPAPVPSSPSPTGPAKPLPGASERMREAGGRFPRRWGRPRRGVAGDSAVTPRVQVPAEPCADRGALPVPGIAPLAPRLLDLAAAACYLSVSPWVVRDLEHAGKLRRVRLDLGKRDVRRVLYDVADLDALVDNSKESAG